MVSPGRSHGIEILPGFPTGSLLLNPSPHYDSVTNPNLAGIPLSGIPHLGTSGVVILALDV